MDAFGKVMGERVRGKWFLNSSEFRFKIFIHYYKTVLGLVLVYGLNLNAMFIKHHTANTINIKPFIMLQIFHELCVLKLSLYTDNF